MAENTNSLSRWNNVSEGVYIPYPDQFAGAISIGSNEIEELKVKARESSRKRARICAHSHHSNALHQMILVIQKESYIHPHRHHDKVESFHLIEGEMDVVLFSDDGKVLEVIPLCAYPKPNGSVFYRLDKALYHTILIYSPYVVFQEITQGPFEAAKSDYAPWAPQESDKEKSLQWVEDMKVSSRRGQQK